LAAGYRDSRLSAGDRNGIECGDALRERYPDCKVIITYCTFADHWLGDAQKTGFEVFGKPVLPEILLAAANPHLQPK